MRNKVTKFLLCFVALQIFGQLATIESKAMPKIGKKTSFGAGILAGGLAGAAIGHVLTRNDKPREIHHHHVADPNLSVSVPAVSNSVLPQSKPATIIEKIEILPNGCYKQTVKEPDQNDVTKFIRTEQLVCSPNSPAPAASPVVHLVPAVSIHQPLPVVSSMHVIQVPVHIKPVETTNSTSNASPNLSLAPVQPYPSLMTGQSSNVANNQVPQLPTGYPMQPVVGAVVAATGQSQVTVLSKTTGFYEEKKKKSSANILLASCFSFLISAILVMDFF